jgi:Zn-dependent M28 family amino/carboxypeptidase
MSRYLEAAALASASMLALMTASMAQEAAAPTPEAPVSVARAPNDDIRLRQAVTVEGILEHERAFSQIAKRNDGTRVSGSPGHEKSVDYVARLLKDKGYKVANQRFTFDFFEETAPSSFARVSPSPKTFVNDTDFATFEYSGSGNVSGRLVATNDIQIPPAAEPGSTSGCEAGDFPAPPAPKSIALIQRGTCDFGVKVANAKAAGYAAAIVFNEGQAGRTDVVFGTLGAPETIPAIGTTFALGQELYNQVKKGKVTVSISTSTFTEERTTRNVIADWPGGDANRIVVVGAHLDSVPEGPGINDNGSGSATILEIALQMRRLNLKLRNRVRFAFWAAEESGLIGSDYYVAHLSDAEKAKIDLNLNFDMLGSPNFVRFVYDGDGSDSEDAGPPGSDLIEQVFVNFFDAQNLETEPTAFDGRSDYGPFILEGTPAGGLFSGAEELKTKDEAKVYGRKAGAPYDSCYHQACDTINNLSKTALDQLGDGAAHAVITFANRSDPLPEPAAKVATAQTAQGFLYKGPQLRR